MQPDAESVRAQHARTVEQLPARFSKAAAVLDEAVEELLAFTALPKEHWRQISSNNPQERLNREIRRRRRRNDPRCRPREIAPRVDREGPEP